MSHINDNGGSSLTNFDTSVYGADASQQLILEPNSEYEYEDLELLPASVTVNSAPLLLSQTASSHVRYF